MLLTSYSNYDRSQNRVKGYFKINIQIREQILQQSDKVTPQEEKETNKINK